MIKAGQPVFFGCDVGKFSDSKVGIMDTALFEYEVFTLPLGYSKITLIIFTERIRH